MEIENGRKIGLYTIVGALIAAIIIAGIFISGVPLPRSVKAGKLIVLITDAPADLRNLNLTIDSLSIQNSEGNWISLMLLGGEPIYFDLLALQNVTMALSATEVPVGNYTMLKMHVLTANATRHDGSIMNLKVPSEHIKVLLKPHLEMRERSSITITIDLEPEWSKIAISHSLNLKPMLKAMIG